MSCKECTSIAAGSIGVGFSLIITNCNGAEPLPEIDSAEFRFKSPSGAITDRDASSIEGNVIYYNSVTAEFVTPGVWQYSGRITFTNGSFAPTSIETFVVVKAL